jgi:hypothetical protein
VKIKKSGPKQLYKVVRSINPKTKRQNQMIYCRRCPFKVNKLGNMKDHIKMHTMEEPF